MFYERFIGLCEESGIKPSKVAIDCSFNKGSVSVWKKKYDNGLDVHPTAEILNKISNYFNVSVDYLLEKTDVQTPNGGAISDIDIKFALFGEKADKIPDEKLQEVKNFAKYIMDTYNNE